MTGRLRPWSAIDEYQHLASDALYNNDEQLALLETGSGKTQIAMTAGEELRKAGVIRTPLVFAPLRVAQLTWPNERYEWEHLKDTPMVLWGGAPENWEPSLWRDSRILWGQRTSAEGRLPNAGTHAIAALNRAIDEKAAVLAGEAAEDSQAGWHVVDYHRHKNALNPNQIEDAIYGAERPLEERIKALTAEEKRVNKLLQKAVPPSAWHIVSFESIEWLTELYKPGESPFDLWLVDESGKVARNPKSPRYKALVKHMPKAKIRWAMNATPAPEGAEDLFGQVQIVCGPRLWGKSFTKWRKDYFVPADYNGYSWRLQIGAFPLLMADLNTVAFRVPAEALSYQKNIRHSQIEVELPPKAREAYKAMEKEMAVELEGETDIEVVAMSEATATGKLRQITQGYLYETDERGRRIVHHMHDEKTNALAELIDSLNREPLLVAYQYDEDLENIRKIWKNVPWLGRGTSEAKAAEYIVRWNKRELPVFALHANSGSHGLNLQYGGHHICHLALPWGFDPYKQLNERIDRRGQEHAVFGHHIVARNSKDQDVSNALLEKDANQEKIIQAIRKIA